MTRDDALTPRETEILGLVARGLSNRDIAARLVLSEKTVRNHVERTYAKIGTTNRVGASLYALQHGLVTPPMAAVSQAHDLRRDSSRMRRTIGSKKLNGSES